MKSLALIIVKVAILILAGAGLCRGETASSATIQFSLDAHPENTLMAEALVSVAPDAQVAIEFEASGLTARTTTRTENGSTHEITVIGMRAQTTYTMTAVASFDDGSVLRSSSVEFQTGALPDATPKITLTRDTGEGLGGITLFGKSGSPGESSNPVYFGVDEDREIVWYLHGDDPIPPAPVIRRISTGKWMIFYKNSIALISPAGEILQSWDTSGVNGFHHDAVLLPNDNLLVLAKETAEVDGQTLSVDLLEEITSDGILVWSWSTLDYLDTGRFPGSLSSSSEGNSGLDWSHCNALYYDAEEDSVLVSSRSQNWVFKIDRATSDLIWILGSDEQTSQGFNAQFFTLSSGTWMTAQHAATITSDGQVLLYDNRNDSDGEALNSRAVKYSLDETSWTATQTWESVMPIYTFSYGDADELSNGNILICAGGPSGGRSSAATQAYIREADAQGNAVWEISVDSRIYRAERVSWEEFTQSSESGGCTGLDLSGLPGFDKDYYLAAKLEGLQAVSPDWTHKTTADLETLFSELGYTAQTHYSQYGYTEGLFPNAYFDHDTYIANKADAMVAAGDYNSFESAKIAFLNAWPGDAYLHYLSYGAAEGLNPSSMFDETTYLMSKFAALRSDPDTAGEWENKSLSDLRLYLSEAGLTALTHYLYYGVCEGLSPSPAD